MNILFYSSINIDTVFSVDHISLPGETEASYEVSVGAGGKGTNQSTAFAKAISSDSSKVFLAGKCGEDGRFILDKLNLVGVDTSFMSISECGTGKAIIQVDKNAQNSIILYGGGNQKIEKPEIDSVFDSFSSDDVLCLNCEINNLPYIIDKAVSKGMKIVLNPSPVNEVLKSIDISKISYLVLNEIEASVLTGMEENTPYADMLCSLSAKYPSCEIVLTAGGNGSFCYSEGKTFYCPADKVVPVDTTGAGDTFLGFYCASRFSGMSVEDSLKKASKAASIAVTRKGAMDSIPLCCEV